MSLNTAMRASKVNRIYTQEGGKFDLVRANDAKLTNQHWREMACPDRMVTVTDR